MEKSPLSSNRSAQRTPFRLSGFALLLVLVSALVAAGCRHLPHEHPHIRPIDSACLPAGTSPREVPLYRNDVSALYAEIATIDSFASDCSDEATVKMQLDDIQCKAALTGADAVIRVRRLTHEMNGFINNPNTPFPSVMQGKSVMPFYRGTAIKYQEPVEGEPEPIEETIAPLPPTATPAAPGTGSIINVPLGGNSLFDGDRRRRQRDALDDPFPEHQIRY